MPAPSVIYLGSGEPSDKDQPFHQLLAQRAEQLVELFKDDDARDSAVLWDYTRIYLRTVARYLRNPEIFNVAD